MKIYSIQSTTITKLQNNFRGLWGKEDTKCLSQASYDAAQNCDMGINHTVTTREYHPFLDETPEEIQEILKNATKSYSDLASDRDLTPSNPYAFVDCADYIKETVVKLMPRLEFSSAEFSAYKARELLSKAEMALEDSLKIAKLQQYLRR